MALAQCCRQRTAEGSRHERTFGTTAGLYSHYQYTPALGFRAKPALPDRLLTSPDHLELELFVLALALMFDVERGIRGNAQPLAGNLDRERPFLFDGVRQTAKLCGELLPRVRACQITISAHAEVIV